LYDSLFSNSLKGTIDISDLKVALRALGNEPKKGEIAKLIS
jgi:Ca2+-binding EF-hand superfamily protein